MVPAASRRIPRAPRYSGYRYAWCRFAYRTITVCGVTFQTLPLVGLLHSTQSYNPRPAGTGRVWAVPRSLATTGGITFCFLFLGVLRCFSSPGLPLISRCRAVSPAGCPIRRSADHRSFAPSRGLSQLVTSFIACKSQGIRHTPLPTFFARTCLPLEGRGRRRGETAPHRRPAEDRRFVYFQLSL